MPSSPLHPKAVNITDCDRDVPRSKDVRASDTCESHKSDDTVTAKTSTSSTESADIYSSMSSPHARRSPCLQPIRPSMPRFFREPQTVANIDSPPTIPSSPLGQLRSGGRPKKVTSSSQDPTAASLASSAASPSGGSGKTNGGLAIWEQVAGAMFGSVIAETILYPLDTVKLLQQIHGRGPGELTAEILRTHGLKGFYQGIFSRLVQTVLSNGAFFFFQALFKNKFHGGSTSSISHSMLLNMIAQQMNRLLTTPFEVVANVNQSDPTSTGFFGTFLKIWRTEGLQSFWKGLGVALLLSSNPAFMFTLVDRLTAMLMTLKGRRSSHSQDLISAGEMFFVSGVAKMVATLLTYPLIRAKVLLQTAKGTSIGLLAMLQKILRTDGLKGMYAGVWTMSWKTVIFNALMMAIKQKVHSLLSRVAFVPKAVLADTSASNPQDSANSVYRRQLECLGESLPYDIKGKVVYIDGAWSYLHPSHQHMLAEAQKFGDYLIVGVHDEKTRVKNGHSGGLERYENRLARIRLVRGVDAMLHDAPWVISTDMLHDLNISVVLSGYKGSTFSNSVDPYEKPKQLGIYTSLADPYSGFWRNVVHVMFSNVDTADGPENLTLGQMPNDFQTMFRTNSTGDFTIRRSNSFYFYHDSKDTSTYPSLHSRRARHLAQAQQRRDLNTHELDAMLRAKKAGVQHVLPGSPELGTLGTLGTADFYDEEFHNFELPDPVEKLPEEHGRNPRSVRSTGKSSRGTATVKEAFDEESSNASSSIPGPMKVIKPEEQQRPTSPPSPPARPHSGTAGARSEEKTSASLQLFTSASSARTRADASTAGVTPAKQHEESSQSQPAKTVA